MYISKYLYDIEVFKAAENLSLYLQSFIQSVLAKDNISHLRDRNNIQFYYYAMYVTYITWSALFIEAVDTSLFRTGLHLPNYIDSTHIAK